MSRLDTIRARANKPKFRALSGSLKPRRNPKHKKPAACEACGWEPGVRDRPLNYDHNHGTGEHRGWLCGSCNRALGLAGDNPAILRALARYLTVRGHSPTRSYCRAPLTSARGPQYSDPDAPCQGLSPT